VSDDTFEVSLAISKATLVGTCHQCGEPTTGTLDADEAAENHDTFKMKCVNCGATMELQHEHGDSFYFNVVSQ
jgi:ribosomal protein S27E